MVHLPAERDHDLAVAEDDADIHGEEEEGGQTRYPAPVQEHSQAGEGTTLQGKTQTHHLGTTLKHEIQPE